MYNLMAYVHQLTVLLILNSHLIQIWLPVGYCEFLALCKPSRV